MRKLVRVVKWALLGCCILLVIFFIAFPGQVISLAQRVGDLFVKPVPLVFSGDSTDLQQTVVFPTLDTPIVPGKNIVWCSTMQMAWNELKDKLAKGPVQISKSQEVADRLNNSPYVAQDAPEGSWYAVAGMDIENEVRRQMAKRFPTIELPDFPAGPLLAFAALEVDVAFLHRYSDLQKPLQFKSADGNVSPVRAFGLSETDNLSVMARYQAKVLYNSSRYLTSTPEEFVLELCVHDQVQVVIAHIPLMSTLSDTVEEVATMADEFSQWRKEVVVRRLKEEINRSTDPVERQKELETVEHYAHPMDLLSQDTLAIPATNWRLAHRFSELERTVLLNENVKGVPIELVLQTIDFRMDRTGTRVKSIAAIAAGTAPVIGRAPIPQHYVVDGPFMIMMKKRNCERPFFVMWVDNAELLCPF
ncbi:MAG TPA: hypothetical protein VMZ06_18570 [Candidatus Bathyarchaeia archaeon]|nr:hypothetical protein [Candidatus Bathyarchaeia archaeon]